MMLFLLFYLLSAEPKYTYIGTKLTISGDGDVTRSSIEKLPFSAITDIIIEEGITSVQDRAFNDCSSLVNLKLPTSLKYFGNCLVNTKISSLFIPKGVTLINANRFLEGNLQISEISVDPNNLNYSSYDGCLYTRNLTFLIYCPRLKTSVQFPDVVEEFEYFSFNGLNAQLTLPDSLKRLRSWIFIDCTFSKVEFSPKSQLTMISNHCFHQTVLTSFKIPPNVIYLDVQAFWKTKIIVIECMENSILTTIQDQAFLDGSKLTRISLPSSLQSISSTAFQGCTKLEALEIPNNNFFINIENCIYNANKTTLYFVKPTEEKITIPPTVSVIATSTLQRCLVLQTIAITDSEYFDAKGQIIYSRYFKTALYAAGSADDVEIHWNATSTSVSLFQGIKSLRRVTFQEGSQMKKLDTSTFDGCSNLTSIELPESLEWIYGTCFQYSGISSIRIPPKVTFAGIENFQGCSNLERLEFDENSNCKEITFRFCRDCNKLKYLILPPNLAGVNSYAFDNCSIIDLVIPSEVTYVSVESFIQNTNMRSITFQGSKLNLIDQSAFQGCACVTRIDFPTSVTTISSFAFKGITLLETVEFGNNYNIKTIGLIFQDCPNLKTFRVPPAVTSINQNAFGGCTNLTEFTSDSSHLVAKSGVLYSGTVLVIYPPGRPEGIVEAGTTAIANGAFYGAVGLKKLEFDDNSVVASIGEQTFLGCTSLGELYIPATVETIAKGAFTGCSGLGLIYFESGSRLTEIGASTFTGCTSLSRVVFDGGSKIQKIGANTFDGCSKLTSITLPKTLKEIGANAFLGCSALEFCSIEKGGLLTEIPEGCFSGCSKMGSFTFSPNITKIGSESFLNCKSLIKIDLPSGLKSIGSSAFSGTGISDLLIPINIETISDMAFANLEEIGIVYYCGKKEFVSTVFKGANSNVVAYTMVLYPYENLGGLVATRVMETCMSVPTMHFTSTGGSIGSLAILTPVLLAGEENSC